MHVAVILLLVAIGSVVFHFVSPWWWTEIASNWGSIDTIIIVTFWITGVVFVAVIGFTAYCVYRFHHTKVERADYEPENKKLEIWLTVITSIGVIAMLAPGLVVWNDYVTVPEDAVEVEVMGQQWWWNFRLPGEDGILGTTSVSLISDDNPFGLNPTDVNGQDDLLIESDDLHLLLDQPVNLLLRSIDVLHNFYVPQFRGKMDLVPGMITHFWLTPTRTGEFEILCAELCGVGHHTMRGVVFVDTQEDYQVWLLEQETYADLYASAAAPPLDLASSQATE